MHRRASARPDVAILCNWWNHPELLDGFCEAVAGEAWDELVVVDNASDPETSRQLVDRIGALGGRVLRREQNGQLAGVRESVAATRSEILILLNSDVRPKQSGWVDRLAAQVEPGVLCGHELRAKLGQRYVDGWCLGVRRQDWERLGGYDPAYEEPPYWADVDLSWRAQRLGMRLRAGNFGLVHERNGSIRSFRDEPWFLALRERNRLRLTAKLEDAGIPVSPVLWSQPPVNFFGPISGNMGLGVATRNWLRLLLEAGVEVFAVDVPDPAGRSGHDSEFLPITRSLDERAPHAVNVFSMNPWSFQQLVAQGHRAIELAGRLNAIVPFWELPRIPEDWKPPLAQIDVVLAPTRFIGEAFRRSGVPLEIAYVPQPLETGEPGARDRAAWGVPEDAFLAVTSFELSSDVERKNPWALLAAFERAFPDDPRARLIVKLNNSRIRETFHAPLRRLQQAAARDPRIRILDAVLPYREVLSLYATADVFVSLHRAEGLGLGMLEAMAVGTPVLATGWSGNLDFMDAENAFLVDYELVPVRPSTQVAYTPRVTGPDARWAEPDVSQAAAWLRRIAADPRLARERGERALRSLERRRQGIELSGFFAALQRATVSP